MTHQEQISLALAPQGFTKQAARWSRRLARMLAKDPAFLKRFASGVTDKDVKFVNHISLPHILQKYVSPRRQAFVQQLTPPLERGLKAKEQFDQTRAGRGLLKHQADSKKRRKAFFDYLVDNKATIDSALLVHSPPEVAGMPGLNELPAWRSLPEAEGGQSHNFQLDW